ncbi:MAG: hypothetical protein H0U18_08660 [Pyrinomonadaceae bacterium]|nr:hypothetical protein [Pyrinomonadaceae bacterium]
MQVTADRTVDRQLVEAEIRGGAYIDRVSGGAKRDDGDEDLFSSPSTDDFARPPFPGFEAIFRIPWNPVPALEIPTDEAELHQSLHLDDKHLRVYKTVEVYSARILEAVKEEYEGRHLVRCGS